MRENWIVGLIIWAITAGAISFVLRMFGASADQAFWGGILFAPICWWIAIKEKS